MNERTCRGCRYFDVDEAWSEDDYVFYYFCDVGARDVDEMEPDAPACGCFRAIRKEAQESGFKPFDVADSAL